MTAPFTNEELDAVIGKLSPAMRALLVAIRPFAASFTYNYSCQLRRRGHYLASVGALYRRGMVPKSPEWNGPHAVESRGFIWLNLTPLGAAVKTRLQEPSHAG